MALIGRSSQAPEIVFALILAGLLVAQTGPLASAQTAPQPLAKSIGHVSGPVQTCPNSAIGSPYIPVDSWVYPAMLRLYSLGYVSSTYLGLRPWTRASLGHILEETQDKIDHADVDRDPAAIQAFLIFESLKHELDIDNSCGAHGGIARIDSVYTIARAVSGTSLHDSFHLGSTIVNDYGRPYESGFNNYTGVSASATAGIFAVYVRGEFQGSPSATGYSAALAQNLSLTVDLTAFLNPLTGLPYDQTTIPLGPIIATSDVRFLEAYVSAQYLNHVFSFGKNDNWMGPAQGGSMAFSNNAQNFYVFQINRIEPLRVPLLSRLTGPFRYEFLVGALRGHVLMPNPAYSANPSPNIPNVITPGDPWVHIEKISFKPTRNMEFGFERTALWGGKGHSPVTIHSFLKSFFSLSAPQPNVKNTRDDPGARFGAFDFSYRLPFVRNWLTLYADSEVHDDVSSIDAPRRAAWRPGLYLSHVPWIPKLDVRAESVTTDPPIQTSHTGEFMYWEGLEKQGYTNQGQLFGDWIGREDKGGQGWITYHLSANEWVQVGVRNQKAAKDFISGGTTLNDISFQGVKRIGKELELKGSFAFEHWKAPIYLPGQHTVTATTIQFTWFPQRKVSF